MANEEMRILKLLIGKREEAFGIRRIYKNRKSIMISAIPEPKSEAAPDISVEFI